MRMRRHVATIVAAALMLTLAAPVAAVDPIVPSAPPSAAVSPSIDPSATTDPDPTPASTPSPSAAPAADPTTPPPSAAPNADPAPSAKGRPALQDTQSAVDPTGRWIVLYRSGTNAVASSARQAKGGGFRVERTFTHAAKGFAAKLTAHQAAALLKDPSVVAVVPDEKIELTAQVYPTGINRIGDRLSPAAKIDGIDERVDADVAVVDTGIAPLADLNVVGGYNCSSSDPTAWRDGNGHGTHVAGTIGAIDNATGVVGVAPGVRLWAVSFAAKPSAACVKVRSTRTPPPFAWRALAATAFVPER